MREVSFAVTETFNAVTTQGSTQIGDGTTDTRYANIAMGTTAADAQLTMSSQSGADPATVIDEGGAVVVNFIAPTGGVPAGIADVFITIEWDR